MRGYNRVVLMGNMARDPEVRYTANQTAVAKFAIGVSRAAKQADGTYRDEVIFPTIVAWGSLASFAEKWLRKGAGVLVEGRLNISSYEGKDGAKRTSTSVVADQIRFAGGKNDMSGDTQLAEVAPSSTKGEYAPMPKSQRQYSSARAAARNKVPSAPGFEVGAQSNPAAQGGAPTNDATYALPDEDIPF